MVVGSGSCPERRCCQARLLMVSCMLLLLLLVHVLLLRMRLMLRLLLMLMMLFVMWRVGGGTHTIGARSGRIKVALLKR